jgi:aspartate/methionine/tyrosine aminotransferase
MQMTPFLLDRWLSEYQFATPPIEFDLAASTGPKWTWRELVSQLAPGALDSILDTSVSYGPAPGSAALREAIAEMADVSPAQVIVVTGASEALWMMLLVAAQPGANVVLPYPAFPTFDEAARHLGMEVRHYQLRADTEHAIDLDEVEACIDDRTVIVLVNTPHNPTGAVVSDDQLTKLHDLATHRGTQLVVDEVCHPIYHGPTSASGSRLSAATTVGDLSKALCLSGLRIGWIIEHDPARIEQYEDARSYLTICGAPVSEVLAAGAIRARDTILARAQTVAETNLAMLDAFFDQHSAQLGWVRPTGGMTTFPWLRSGADARPFCVGAARAGVLVAPGDCFGMPSHFRIGFGATEHGFDEALVRLDDVLRTT